MARRRKKENQYVGLFITAFGLFVCAMFFIAFYLFNYVEPTDKYFQAYNKNVVDELKEQLRFQENIDQEIDEVISSHKYTIDEPYVKENPYGISPLSALIVFETEESVEPTLYINDVEINTFAKSIIHEIPVYGLYANASNNIKIVLSNGTTKEIEIKTKPYDDTIDTLALKNTITQNDNLMVIGDTKTGESNLRGFDYYGNIIFYLDLDYINGVTFYNNHYYVSYSSLYDVDNELKNVKVELDYLGRIYSISSNTNDINVTPNVGNNIYQKFNLFDHYSETITGNVLDSKNYTKGTRYQISAIKDELLNAAPYSDDYKLVSNGGYISYKFKESVKLIAVFKDSTYVEEYDLASFKDNLLQVNFSRDVSLYLRVNGEYYSLLTTLKN